MPSLRNNFYMIAYTAANLVFAGVIVSIAAAKNKETSTNHHAAPAATPVDANKYKHAAVLHTMQEAGDFTAANLPVVGALVGSDSKTAYELTY